MNIWDRADLSRSAYSKCLIPVCEKYNLSRLELDILLFMANNPRYDTAHDISEVRQLSKSNISISIRSLESRGYVTRSYFPGNRKTIHIKLTEKAAPVIADGQKQQLTFTAMMFGGFSEDELDITRDYLRRIFLNLELFVREGDTGNAETSEGY